MSGKVEGGMIARLRREAAALRRDAVALYLAARDPRVRWPAKLVALVVAAYVLSPLDLIPDFIPVLGLVDDLVIVSLGILLARRLVPPALLEEHRRTAATLRAVPRSRVAAVLIVALWLALAIALVAYLLRVGSPIDHAPAPASKVSVAPTAIGSV